MRPKIVEELQIIQIRSWIGKPGFCHWRPKNVLFFKCLHPRFSLKKIVRENSRQLATPPLVSPPNDVWETSAEIPFWWHVTTRIWVVLLIGLKQSFSQSESLPWSGLRHQCEFLRSSLRCHFAGKPLVASRNVGSFLKLKWKLLNNFHWRSHLHTWKFDPGSVEINIIKTFVSADTSNWWVCYNKWVQLVHADGWFKTSQLQRGSSVGENCSPRLWSSV